MEYSEIYVKRIRKLCKDRGIAFNMTPVEFLDFDELQDYFFDDDSDDE